MKPLRYERPTDTASAVALVHDNPEAVFLAAGTNLVDHLKLGVATPDMLVDISHLPLDTVVHTADGGLRVGANVRNSALAVHPDVRRNYPMLTRALLAGASPQLRNAATTGGNLLQRTRCVYFRDVSTPCNKREPGSGCSALGGYTRYHAVLGASEECVATHPSDMAVALLALDAEVLVAGPDGERTVALEEFYRLPGDRPDLDTTLERDELVVGVHLPPPQTSLSTYRKVRDRASYAFALVSVAAELTISGGTVTGCRIAFGGVAHRPWRAHRTEAALLGQRPDDDLFARAADAELVEADALEGNAFKIPLLRRTVAGVLRDLAGRHDEGVSA
ncbi:FAD binding domain-containing protein [Rhodococcus coprophilus]|uniref:Xanthine dehydrogenase fad-binding subunit n=1 Tax=Rhodococcus coprophilus TaxID=38310 RepID=A0A2X4UJF1_9NOCA|nr:xanthine dehydrogenase family protein subunit M [Rhodococcus coprophilus]MBM7460226.1 xanthine dehydrogenase YagS FAD-binding subunit [Rhodococcus coprophilus]SQI38789.1 xanthine dehydrogenase fad-binding subunit [Rhodococcus coprophilus]